MSRSNISTVFIVLSIMLMIVFSIILKFCLDSDENYTAFVSTERNTSNSFSMFYEYFGGIKYRNVRVPSNTNIEFNIDVETKDGDLTVSLLDGDLELLKINSPDEIINHSLYTSENTLLIIKIEGNHNGSFEINWNAID